jgi:hypothetical protein
VINRDTVRGAQQFRVPYTLELIGRRNDGKVHMVDSYNRRRFTDRTVHGSIGTFDGFADITYYMNPADNYLGDIRETHFRALTQALQDFRN